MTCMILLIGCLYSLCLEGQNVEDNTRRISEGKSYLTNERLEIWERCLREGPDQLGRVEWLVDQKKLSEGWVKDGHSIYRNGLDTKYDYLDISNPKYFARLRTLKSNTVLDYFYQYRNNQEATKPQDRFVYGSGYADKSIPEQLRLGKIEIADYRHEGNFHYIKFVPSPKLVNEDDPVNQIDFVELRFDTRYPPMPDGWAYQEKGKTPRTFIARDFEKVGDYWWHTKGGIIEGLKLDVGDNPDWKMCSISTGRAYFPNETFDPQHCILAHYGIAEPGMPPIADFGRGGNRWFWPTIIVSAMIGAGVALYWYRSRK